MPGYLSNSRAVSASDPRLDRWLRNAVVAGFMLSLLLPWRSEWLGFTPLWLLGMPLMAWWALHRFRLPAPVRKVRVGRRGAQARRRKPLMQKKFLRAA